MANAATPRVRRSLRELEDLYASGDIAPLENLMIAWQGIKELPPDHPDSFFSIAGLHGEPFRDKGATDGNYWGGWCNHNNILFPTWHRVYLLKLEEALRKIPGCEEVTLPYWDETEHESITRGVPWSLTNSKVTIKGKLVDNPLLSYKFQVDIKDNVTTDKSIYSKPAGTSTVRYPYSGLVGTPEDKQKSDQHNAQFNSAQAMLLLNDNVVGWLNKTITLPDIADRLKLGGVIILFQKCLDAPNYTVFSNITSSGQWNKDNPKAPVTVALETPHNDIHLAVGGFNIPGKDNPDFSPIPGANGDMGENDTAGFDPIFYFHHCNVDRMFWVWQKKHDHRTSLSIINGYPGTSSSDGGPSAGYGPNEPLTLDSPLKPFKHNNSDNYYTSNQVVDIENQCGYTYSVGSLDLITWMHGVTLAAEPPTNKLRVSNINRGNIYGSFVITAYANVDGQDHYIGHQSILSRWNVLGCENCRAHLQAEAFFNVDNLAQKSKDVANFRIEVTGREEAQPLLSAAVAENTINIEIL
ncbi:tyrosinase family protein [Chitinophaga sp. sic0106]|uniref:tyrosinase family protein n=1 Tax=Chitinophaga sp. sic0106 TaxID=2854785 RepID=UPI001C4917C0|nr:tyrosinase family protein [Chitinophaga sp. sic0106]MBV7530784.1 tyrosinase family protein [Chitinophaga sp. sic0106]